jgi:hypothetical protein
MLKHIDDEYPWLGPSVKPRRRLSHKARLVISLLCVVLFVLIYSRLPAGKPQTHSPASRMAAEEPIAKGLR